MKVLPAQDISKEASTQYTLAGKCYTSSHIPEKQFTGTWTIGQRYIYLVHHTAFYSVCNKRCTFVIPSPKKLKFLQSDNDQLTQIRV